LKSSLLLGVLITKVFAFRCVTVIVVSSFPLFGGFRGKLLVLADAKHSFSQDSLGLRSVHQRDGWLLMLLGCVSQFQKGSEEELVVRAGVCGVNKH
jgi:hypothetical protein